MTTHQILYLLNEWKEVLQRKPLASFTTLTGTAC